jgi:cytoskeletal protein CcmA (bactofilin family)
MTNGQFRLGAPNIAYIGEGVVVKGSICVPDIIVVDGVVEGDVTAQSIKIGPSGSIKGNVVSTDVEVSGTLGENAEVKEVLVIRSKGRIEGHINCGDMQVEKGAVIAGGIVSVYSGAEPMPVNDNAPHGLAKRGVPPVNAEWYKLNAGE